ncbi:MAG: hypothetical protein K9M80_08405, partial [Candidatus Marinimicrobia bacterium]|nr:hypothetical protein [Candidatus Neomarinimicrobiota bacterium]
GFFIGNSFLKDESFTSLEVDLEYLLSDNSRLGSYCNHYLGRGQTNLALFYKYKYSNNINMRAGLDLNYMNSDWALMEKYSYPDENKIYKIKNSFSASFFIEPGIEFNQGNLYIRQTVVTNFIFLSGNVTGLAYHFRPVINIGYRIF